MQYVFERRRRFGQEDFDRFAALSGDDNPIHVDAAFAARTKFGKTVAHGMLLYAVVGAALEEVFGRDAHQLEQTLMFPGPVYVDEEVVVRGQVVGRPTEGLVDVGVELVRPDGSLGLQGVSRLRLPGSSGGAGADRAPEPLQEVGGTKASAGGLKGMRLGDRATCRRVFSAEDLVAYKMLVGRGELAAGVGIAPGDGEEGRRVPPALVGGLFSYLLGTRLPGPGTNYLKQYLRFRAAAYPEQELRAAVEIVRIRVDKQLVNLRTVCTNARDEVVAEGEALVLVSDVS